MTKTASEKQLTSYSSIPQAYGIMQNQGYQDVYRSILNQISHEKSYQPTFISLISILRFCFREAFDELFQPARGSTQDTQCIKHDLISYIMKQKHRRALHINPNGNPSRSTILPSEKQLTSCSSIPVARI